MGYRVDPNAKNVWVRDIDDTEDLPLAVNASSVYFNSGKTMEQEVGKGTMVSNVVTVDGSMEKVVEGTYDGAYESCKMYGKSLVNLFNSKQITPSLHFSSNNDGKYENIVKSNGLIEFDIVGSENPGNYQYINMGKVNVDLLKPNTRYLVLFEEITGIDTVSIRDGNSANTVIDYAKVGGKQYVILTTLSEWQKSNQILYLYVQSKTGIHVKVKNAMIIEYQEGMEQWDLDYFEGLCDVKAPILKNVGKNILPKEIGKWYSCYFKKGTTFQLTTKDNKPSKGGNIVFVDGSGAKMWMGIDSGTTKKTYTLPNDAYKISNQLTSGVEYQLETNINATPYEDYKTNILETSNDVVLRGLPNGVKDSYDCLTGEYVRRVGKIVLNGSENWAIPTGEGLANNNTLMFNHTVAEMKELTQQEDYSTKELLCDKQKVSSSNSLWNTDEEGVSKGLKMKDIRFRILKSRLSTEDVNGLKLYLQANPITVQYELAEPIVTTIEPSTTPFAYENGHIILESGHEGQSLLPTLEYQTVVSRSGQVAMIDKTIQQHERKITLLEKMLVQNIIDIEYKNTLLALKLEIDEVI